MNTGGDQRMDIQPSRESSARMPGTPWVVLVASLLLTGVTTAYMFKTIRSHHKERFAYAVEAAEKDIRERMESYITLLRGGAGLFAGSNRVSRTEFQEFVRRLQLRTRYPGIQGIGVTLQFPGSELEEVVSMMRAQGVEDFRVWPELPREVYNSIIYLEPLDVRNRAAIGYDMYTEPVRRAAMERARDTGEVAASGRVVLVQEIDANKQPGFLVYLPIYRNGTLPTELEDKRRLLLGYIYSPFRAGDLFAGVFGDSERSDLVVQIYDGRVATDSLLYSSGEHDRARFRATRTIRMAGVEWPVVMSSSRAFEAASSELVVYVVLVGGLLISGLLFGLNWIQTRARVRAEESALELRRSRQQLVESEARLRRLVDANIIAIIIGDLQGRIITANDAFLSLAGYSRAELEAGTVNWLRITAPDEQHLDRAAVEQMRRSGRHEPFEKNLIRKDGHRVPVLAGTAYLAGPQELGVGFFIDLTERKRTEEALAQYRDHLEALVAERTKQLKASLSQLRRSERLASLGTLATGIAHEINNPVNAILLSSQYALTIKDEPGTMPEITAALESIGNEARRCGKIVKNILRFGRQDACPQRTPQDLNEVVRRGAELASRYTERGRLQLHLELEPDLPAMKVDAIGIEQVLINLVQNAAQAGTGGVKVHVRTERMNGGARVVVSDDGPGIPADKLQHIFDPFFSTRRERGGTGLGLSMVHGIIAEHGGTIDVDSAPGRGTTFSIHLPPSEGAGDGENSHRGG